jgi:hypothetical protein
MQFKVNREEPKPPPIDTISITMSPHEALQMKTFLQWNRTYHGYGPSFGGWDLMAKIIEELEAIK